MKKEILLIRHTTPEVEKGICYGQLDLDVTANFEQEASEIAQSINGFNPDVIFSSPLQRCRKLANHLFPNHSIDIDERIIEMNFGQWEGQKWEGIERFTIEQWSNNFLNQSPPNGEKFSELLARTNNFFEFLENSNKKYLAVVTHSGVIRSALHKYLAIPPNNIFNLDLHYGCIIKITFKGNNYYQVEFIKG
ncbi:alpha-ribazole phosphatase [Carboxylicivirga linearis]|uniref:Alpha-ribazole phosphatase n=1 Tax=Carboxylicivirga linearis TaxID=1628157 RepID=A0ABS5JQY8_9BACT|nr:alpha-ribazole phosphatase [Carboxylicivirga linearis]MBS2097318.1 alpha-ribazole phosphatase [Carboxylicivirga linearis]